MEKESNPEYTLWFIDNNGRHDSVLVVYKKGMSPLKPDACVYRIRGEDDVLRRTYHELLAVMQLAGETLKNGDVRCVLDRESILAVVPQWRRVI